MANLSVFFFFFSCLILSSSLAFQSDELLVDDDEFGLEGSKPQSTQLYTSSPASSSPQQQTPTIRRRYSDPDLDSKVQFGLEHAFGDSDFSPAGTFSARLKTWSHGGKTLTKLRFSRNAFSAEEKDAFKDLLKGDDFYRIRIPSNVVSPPGKEFVIASVRARCLPRDGLDEHFIIHMEGANILAVSYGSPGACQYPRQFKLGSVVEWKDNLCFWIASSSLCPRVNRVGDSWVSQNPAKWSFNSHTILKSSEQAPRTPIFTEEILGSENAESEVEPPPERSFWAKYWMYLIPLGLVVMNVVTQASNVAETLTGEQAGAQVQQSVRRR